MDYLDLIKQKVNGIKVRILISRLRKYAKEKYIITKKGNLYYLQRKFCSFYERVPGYEGTRTIKEQIIRCDRLRDAYMKDLLNDLKEDKNSKKEKRVY